MISNLDEKCLLKFLSGNCDKDFTKDSEIVNLLREYNIDIKFENFNQIYDIIDEYENN